MSTASDDGLKFVARSDVTSCTLGDGAALLDMRDGVYYSVNAVGAHVWGQLEAPTSLATICSSVTSAFDVPADRCLADVRAMLAKLANLGIVETVRDASL